MANVTKIEGSGQGPKQNLQALVDKALSDLFKRSALPADQDRRSLGADAKKVVAEAEAQLKKAGGNLAPDALGAFVDKLRVALASDKLKALDLGPAPQGANALIPATGDLVAKSKDGVYSLVGTVATPTHGLSQLLQKLGLDPQNLSPNVADRLAETVRGRGFSLSSQKDFEKLALTLAEVSPMSKVGGAKISKPSSQKTAENNSQVRQGVASAPTEIGKGTSANALNALISNKLSGADAKSSADELKKTAIDSLIKGAGLETVKPEVRAELEKMLDKVLADPSSPNKPSPGRILSNAFVELSRSTGDREWMKGAAFATQLQATLDKVPADQRGAMEQNLAIMALPLLEAASAAKLSKLTGGNGKLNAQPSADAMKALTQMLSARGVDVSALDTDKVLRESRGGAKTQEAPKADATQQTGKVEGAPGKFDAKSAAADFVLKELGIDPKDKDAKKAMAGVEDLLKRAGSLEHQAVFQAGFDLFKEKTGFEHPYKAAMSQMDLQGEQADKMRSQFMLKAAEAAVDPKFFENAKVALQAAQAQAAAGGVEGMEGMAAARGIPGFTGMGVPSDGGNPMRQMQVSQRTMMCASILRDPALTIEDKLFLFMMYMGMFASQDELKKAEELAELDRAEEQRSSIIRKTQTSLQNEAQTRSAAKRAADDARAKFETVSQQPGAAKDAVESAKKEMEATGSAFKRSMERERALQTDLNTLKGPQDLPKSREQLTMELRRMEDLKRLFQDMVQALLQSFKESTRQTIQQMGR